MKYLPAAALIAVLAGACVGSGEYSGFTRLPDAGWAYGDTVFFTPVDTAASFRRFDDAEEALSAARIPDGRLTIAIVHDNSYQYSNLWLEVSYPQNGDTRRDTVELTLCDDYGHWLGSGLGSSYQLQATLPRPVSLEQGERVGVRHIMRVDTLRHISRIGLDIKGDSDKNR